MWLTLLIILALVAFAFLISVIRKNQNYFADHKIPYLKSPALLGAYAEVVLGKKGVYDKVMQIYHDAELKNEKYFGVYIFHKPALFLKDPEIIKQIMITDFNSLQRQICSSNAARSTRILSTFSTQKSPLENSPR
jgi:cytochrome P450 family 6